MKNPSLNSSNIIQATAKRYGGFHIFALGISLRVNGIVGLEFKFLFKATIHYVIGTLKISITLYHNYYS